MAGKNNTYFIGQLNMNVFCNIFEDIIIKPDVIITEERIAHIKDRHPGDYERFYLFIPSMIAEPDYIIRDERSFTVLLMKKFPNMEKYFRLTLRLIMESEKSDYSHSVLTFMHVHEKEYQRIVRNRLTIKSQVKNGNFLNELL